MYVTLEPVDVPQEQCSREDPKLVYGASDPKMGWCGRAKMGDGALNHTVDMTTGIMEVEVPPSSGIFPVAS